MDPYALIIIREVSYYTVCTGSLKTNEDIIGAISVDIYDHFSRSAFLLLN